MTTYITNEKEVGLPPLQTSRKAVWDYYRIEFLPNGYPGRRHHGVLSSHPLYGTYVISDYMAQYRLTKDDAFLEAAKHVANAAVGQMTFMDNSLVFLYNNDTTAVSSKSGVFYSGLTQARYIDVFSKLVRLPGSTKFQEPLSAIVKSLIIPAENGGVARSTENGGLIIEEYPSLIPDCTLNGWTTATCILRDYAERTDSEEGWEIFSRSVRGLEHLIALYDVPELANSRYRLTGPASIRLSAIDTGLELSSCSVDMPGNGIYAANTNDDPAGQVISGGLPKIPNGLSETLTVSLSRMTWPRPNRILLSINSTNKGLLEVAIGEGSYSPMRKDLPVENYRNIGSYALIEGNNQIEIPIPWVDAELVAYPTGFGKAIAKQQFNQYHWIHVDTLAKIADQTGSDVLRYFEEKWRRYPSRWPDMPQYQDERITLERFDPQKHK